MQVAIVATLCFAAVGQQPVCRDEVAMEAESIGLGCLIGEAQVAGWKDHSIYRGPQWIVSRIRCVPGGYVAKEPT
jgi:hypothetical protein